MPEDDWLHTWIGSSDRDRITVAGLDLPSEVMGRLTLTELAYLLVTRRRPTEGQRRMVDAVFVSLADHGLTPSALATRLTHTGAPESVQGAVAAGLLGAGSVLPGLIGGEGDQATADAPSCLEILGASPVALKVGGMGRVDTTLYTAASGALVFAAGSFQLGYGADDFAWPAHPARSSTASRRLLENLFDRLSE